LFVRGGRPLFGGEELDDPNGGEVARDALALRAGADRVGVGDGVELRG